MNYDPLEQISLSEQIANMAERVVLELEQNTGTSKLHGLNVQIKQSTTRLRATASAKASVWIDQELSHSQRPE